MIAKVASQTEPLRRGDARNECDRRSVLRVPTVRVEVVEHARACRTRRRGEERKLALKLLVTPVGGAHDVAHRRNRSLDQRGEPIWHDGRGGVEVDLVKAMHWYQKSAAQEFQDAIDAVERLNHTF